MAAIVCRNVLTFDPSKRSRPHHGNRADGGDLIGPEQAEHHGEQQRGAAGDCRLGNQYDLSASLGDLGKLLEPRFDP